MLQLIPNKLDVLYHQGSDGWKAMLAKVMAIKDKYPKPE